MYFVNIFFLNCFYEKKNIFYRKDGFARISNFLERLHEKQYDSQNIEDDRYKTHDDRADGHSKYTPIITHKGCRELYDFRSSTRQTDIDATTIHLVL